MLLHDARQALGPRRHAQVDSQRADQASIRAPRPPQVSPHGCLPMRSDSSIPGPRPPERPPSATDHGIERARSVFPRLQEDRPLHLLSAANHPPSMPCRPDACSTLDALRHRPTDTVPATTSALIYRAELSPSRVSLLDETQRRLRCRPPSGSERKAGYRGAWRYERGHRRVPTQRECQRLAAVGGPDSRRNLQAARRSQRLASPYNACTARVLRSRPSGSRRSARSRVSCWAAGSHDVPGSPLPCTTHCARSSAG